MNTVTTSPPACKPGRTVRFQRTPSGKVMTVTERTGKRITSTAYHLEEIPVGYGGRGFKLVKVERSSGTDKEEDTYHVRLARDGHSCECKGFLRHDHCKHVEGLIALENAGQLVS